MENKITININIADRIYPIKVEKRDEEKVNKSASLINEKVLQYRQKFPDKDNQDLLAMASIQFAIKLTDVEENNLTKKLEDSLRELNEELAEFLMEEEIE